MSANLGELRGQEETDGGEKLKLVCRDVDAGEDVVDFVLQ